MKYRFTGYRRFLDADGYPAIAPPWGTLNAIDLNTGEYVWKIHLGEYPELAAKGMTNTGSENYGGPVVTAGGLLFIGATNYDKKFRAFDKSTGKLLWETTPPIRRQCDARHLRHQWPAICRDCCWGRQRPPSHRQVAGTCLSLSPPKLLNDHQPLLPLSAEFASTVCSASRNAGT